MGRLHWLNDNYGIRLCTGRIAGKRFRASGQEKIASDTPFVHEMFHVKHFAGMTGFIRYDAIVEPAPTPRDRHGFDFGL